MYKNLNSMAEKVMNGMTQLASKINQIEDKVVENENQLQQNSAFKTSKSAQLDYGIDKQILFAQL